MPPATLRPLQSLSVGFYFVGGATQSCARLSSASFSARWARTTSTASCGTVSAPRPRPRPTHDGDRVRDPDPDPDPDPEPFLPLTRPEGVYLRCHSFFKLFPLLDRADQGLALYGSYLADILLRRTVAALEGLRGAANGDHVQLVTHLYEQLANIIDRQEALVETHYTPGSMLTLIERLQRECDQLLNRILLAFTAASQLAAKVDVLAGPRARVGPRGGRGRGHGSGAGPRTVGGVRQWGGLGARARTRH